MNRILFTAFSVALLSVSAQISIGQTPAWKVSVVSVSSDAPEFVSGGKTGGKSSGYWPGRPSGHSWVALTVRVTSPSKDATMAASDIQISDSNGNYPVSAIGYQAKPKDSIVYFPLLILAQPHPDQGMKESKSGPKTGGGWSTLYMKSADGKFGPSSTGFFEKMDVNKMLFEVLFKGESGGREVKLAKSPLDLVLLFAVPDGASNLQLKFGNGEPVAVPAVP